MMFGTVGGRFVLTDGRRYADVEAASGGRLPGVAPCVFDAWHELIDWASSVTELSEELDWHALGPVAPNPRQVFALGLNYLSHAREGGVEPPAHPMVFTKFPSCIAGPYETISLPSDKVDWEVELVVVMGRACHRIAAADAWRYVAGLTVGQDISEREVQNRKPAPQFSLGKSFPGFAPIGPVLVTPDEFPDPDCVSISCSVNGEVVQQSTTADLIFPIPELIAFISSIVPMLPGDLIFTGTPAGVGMSMQPPRFLRAGDVLESRVEGIGTMMNTMAGER